MSRRTWLAGAAVAAVGLPVVAADAGLAAPSSASAVGQPTHLAAAWDEAQGYCVGVLGGAPAVGRALPSLSTIASIDVPTRAHGILVEAHGDSLLAVARRPGDWLLRWRPNATKHARDKEAAAQWVWNEADRSFNGHVMAGPCVGSSPSPRWIFTTETDLDTGLGLVGVRDAHTLAKLREWPTHGVDPHEMLLDERGLWVANGGIPTQPETGRAKVELHRMDPSLVCLDPLTGRLLGQWRLLDPRLSVRHLASGAGGRIGVALQAEHDAQDARRAAPVLAVFDGDGFEAIPMPEGLSMQGYGGDIAALRDGGFVVSSPKAGCAASWRPDAGWLPAFELPLACALAVSTDGVLWCAGEGRALRLAVQGSRSDAPAWLLPAGARLDNHWMALRPWGTGVVVSS